MLTVAADKARSDDDFRTSRNQSFANFRNIGRLVLPVAIHTDHMIETKLEGDFVACLDAPTHSKMNRKAKDLRACSLRHSSGGIGGEIVDDQDGHARQHFPNRPNNVTNGFLFVEGRHDDHQFRFHHAFASCLAAIRWRYINLMNSAEPILRVLRI